ncbi:MAG: DUF1330 domain-containing protein [Parvularcula sp.]|jgi:uncharacterized protein (DUF1330 family)|nr:DUF1330 domain-containing protein [Parvularcula sp.]
MRRFSLVIAALVACSAAWADETQPETPAYLVVIGEVHDREAFMQGYAAKLGPLYARYGGSYLSIGGQVEVLEGDLQPESLVLARWPSMEAARAFWFSPEYQELRRQRRDNDWGRFDVLLVPGIPATVTSE